MWVLSPALHSGLKGPALAAVAQILPLVWELHMPWGGQKIVMYMYIYIYIYVCVCVCVCVCIMKFYSGIEKNEIFPFAMTSINLEDKEMLDRKGIHCTISLICGI